MCTVAKSFNNCTFPTKVSFRFALDETDFMVNDGAPFSVSGATAAKDIGHPDAG